MKCPSCGAETKEKICEYCGSEMPQEKNNVNIINNYYGDNQESNEVDNNVGICPKCGSSKITFKRERIGTVTKSNSRKNYLGTGRNGHSVSQSKYVTVGVCQNCGYTWNPNESESNKKTGKKTWLWVLGWICIFPLPLTILLLRKKDMKPAFKYGIIAVAWVLFLLIGILGNNKADTTNAEVSSHSVSSQESNSIDISSNIVSDNTVNYNESEELVSVLNNYIIDFVSKYNSQATEQLEFCEDFTPSDKDGIHYRTEFRLNAYKHSVGKSFLLEGKVVDFIAFQNLSGDINCRVYTNDTSLDQVIALIKGLSPIMDKTLSEDDLKSVINEISSQKYVNGYSYGGLIITLFGNDESGYEMMIKND